MQVKTHEKISREFYLRNDVVAIARQLIGKVIFTSFGGHESSGIICETEAYAGITDKASHAYGGRRSNRTAIMYKQGGTAYVYLCYGVHSLFNIVTAAEGNPHAVLLRGIIPYSGFDVMKQRLGAAQLKTSIGIGPGKVSRLLGIHYSHTGMDLCDFGQTSDCIWLEDHAIEVPDDQVMITQRIGIDYAGEDAALPYRFVWAQKKQSFTL